MHPVKGKKPIGGLRFRTYERGANLSESELAVEYTIMRTREKNSSRYIIKIAFVRVPIQTYNHVNGVMRLLE